MNNSLKGTEHNDIKVELNDLPIPPEYYDIVDGNVQLNQQGYQYIKSISKQNYYERQREEREKPA